jgi:periplasmic divalent cation tolerance protein
VSYVVVFVTAGSAEEADRIGQTLVAERLAACANLIPAITSTYRWQGRVERAAEALLILKTREELVGPLQARVRALHTYTVPEVIACRIVAGLPDYLRWIDDSVRQPGDRS